MHKLYNISQSMSDLAISSLILSPRLHDKGIINRDADDLVDTLCFQVGSSFKVPWQVGLAAARCESSGHPKDHNLAHRTLTFANGQMGEKCMRPSCQHIVLPSRLCCRVSFQREQQKGFCPPQQLEPLH